MSHMFMPVVIVLGKKTTPTQEDVGQTGILREEMDTIRQILAVLWFYGNLITLCMQKVSTQVSQPYEKNYPRMLKLLNRSSHEFQ